MRAVIEQYQLYYTLQLPYENVSFVEWFFSGKEQYEQIIKIYHDNIQKGNISLDELQSSLQERQLLKGSLTKFPMDIQLFCWIQGHR